MIDFVSTRPSADPQTKAAAQFLASVVAEFLRSASAKPTKEEVRTNRNLNDSQNAIEYFFKAGTAAEDHLEALGGNVFTLREALLSDRTLHHGSPFTEAARRIIRIRHGWWQQSVADRAAAHPASLSTFRQGEPA